MVDYKAAFSAETKIMDLLKTNKKLDKYKLSLHHTDRYNVDVVATAAGYKGFAIEIESTESGKWASEEPFPMTWKKGVSVPTRKKKFFDEHPMSLYVKVNHSFTRALVVPMSYIFSSNTEGYKNSADSHYKNNEFYLITDAEHPALCFCSIEDLPTVVDEHFSHMTQLKRVNAKYTDMRPTFAVKKEKEKEK